MGSVEPFNSAWPVAITPPATVVKWVGDFYHLADDQSADAGERLAQLLTPDATIYGLARPLKGRGSLIYPYDGCGCFVDNTQIYTSKADYSDILVFGTLKSWFKNGEIVDVEFVAGITFDGDTLVDPKFSLYRVWGDNAPWIKAMSKKT